LPHEALDIETDIQVMDGMLRREGLKDKNFSDTRLKYNRQYPFPPLFSFGRTFT
jgi:hypothetical protein